MRQMYAVGSAFAIVTICVAVCPTHRIIFIRTHQPTKKSEMWTIAACFCLWTDYNKTDTRVKCDE